MGSGLQWRGTLPTTTLRDFGPQTVQQRALITDKVMAIRWATHDIRRTEPSAPNAVVQPVASHTQMPGKTADRPHAINGVGLAILLVRTNPLVLMADLQDGRSGDVRAACRAEAF